MGINEVRSGSHDGIESDFAYISLIQWTKWTQRCGAPINLGDEIRDKAKDRGCQRGPAPGDAAVVMCQAKRIIGAKPEGNTSADGSSRPR